MTLIDWSDPESLLDLLSDYVADEAATRSDERAQFLLELREDLAEVIDAAADDALTDTIERLRGIESAHRRECSGDAALAHLRDCIEELERLREKQVS